MKPFSVSITVSDPWDVGEAVNWQPINGQLLRMENDEKGGQALIKFDKAISYHGSEYHYAVASPRIEGHQMTELNTGKMVCAALTCISEQQAECGSPLDTSNWRGGLGFLGDIVPTGNQ